MISAIFVRSWVINILSTKILTQNVSKFSIVFTKYLSIGDYSVQDNKNV